MLRTLCIKVKLWNELTNDIKINIYLIKFKKKWSRIYIF